MADSTAQVTITLPAVLTVGAMVEVSGPGTGGWKITQNAGQQIHAGFENVLWTQVGPVHSSSGQLAASGDAGRLAATAYGGPIYTSTDGGTTWIAQNSGNSDWSALAMSADGTHLVAAESGGQLHTSPDSGVTWTAQGPSLLWETVGVSPDGADMIADGWDSSSQQYNLYTSSDSGATWALQASNFVLPSIAWPTQTQLIGVGTGSVGSGILMSSDAGVTWTLAEPNPNGIQSYTNFDQVAASSDGSHIYAVGEGLTSSTDSGATWTVNQSAPWISVATSADSSVVVASAGAGLPVSISTNSGQYWTQLGSGGHYFSAFVVASDDQKVIGAVDQGSLYALSAVTTVGTAGFVAGNQYQSATLQYFGNGLFSLVDNEGQLTVQ
jgi:hypothetical protein